LNICEDEEWFEEFIREKYKAVDVENIKITFLKCWYVVAKMQLRFGVIWEQQMWKMKVCRSY
jgi:hypothetical protein